MEEDYNYLFQRSGASHNNDELQPLPPSFHSGGGYSSTNHHRQLAPPNAAGGIFSFSHPANKMLCFDSSTFSSKPKDDEAAARSLEFVHSSSKGGRRSPSEAREHIIAERKRRENLSQRLIALSAIIPGLNKKDKASVLEDAVNYLNHLHEKIKQLEHELTKRRTNISIESAVLVNTYGDDQLDSISCRDIINDRGCQLESKSKLPEIEARMSEKDVMIRIHCEKRAGAVAEVLSQVESLRLSVVNTSVLPFGNSTLHITVIAKRVDDDDDDDGELWMTVKELVKKLGVRLDQSLN